MYGKNYKVHKGIIKGKSKNLFYLFLSEAIDHHHLKTTNCLSLLKLALTSVIQVIPFATCHVLFM